MHKSRWIFPRENAKNLTKSKKKKKVKLHSGRHKTMTKQTDAFREFFADRPKNDTVK